MAGITDRPFRNACRRLGAQYVVGEMLTSKTELWSSTKSASRLDHLGEPSPVVVQIAGADPLEMAAAARACIDSGAHIVDINMGCPVKKVCNRWAGSALMAQLPLAVQIMEAVVGACEPRSVPVTLKMRTGVSADHRNALALAMAAQDCGVRMVAVHGRTRDQRYKGVAEHETVAAVKAALCIPVVANGDVDSPVRAQALLEQTGVDAVMVGRAAQGRPWLLGQVDRFLAGHGLPEPILPTRVVAQTITTHQLEHHALYGAYMGPRSFRKHLRWYLGHLPEGADFCDRVNAVDDPESQLCAVAEHLDTLVARYDSWPERARQVHLEGISAAEAQTP